MLPPFSSHSGGGAVAFRFGFALVVGCLRCHLVALGECTCWITSVKTIGSRPCFHRWVVLPPCSSHSGGWSVAFRFGFALVVGCLRFLLAAQDGCTCWSTSVLKNWGPSFFHGFAVLPPFSSHSGGGLLPSGSVSPWLWVAFGFHRLRWTSGPVGAPRF